MKSIFYISVKEVQEIALRLLKRHLTKNELETVKDGIESALRLDLDTVIRTAIKESIKN